MTNQATGSSSCSGLIRFESLEPRVQLSAVALPVVRASSPVHERGWLSESRFAILTATVGEKAIFAGGNSIARSSAIDVFDGTSGQWSTARSVSSTGLTSAASNGEQAFFASDVGVDIYDGATSRWSNKLLPTPRDGISACASESEALFAGGYSVNSGRVKPSDAVDILNTHTGNWSTAELSQARYDMSVARLGPICVFAGGKRNPLQEYSDVVDIYDSATGRWTVGRLSQPRDAMAVATIGSLAIFAGGEAAHGASRAVDIYDTATHRWSTTKLPAASEGAGGQVGSKLVVISQGNVAEIYDTVSGRWSTAVLHGQHQGAAMAQLGRRLIIAGGGDSLDGLDTIVDVYDDATGKWTTSRLSKSRNLFGSAVVAGRAIFAGGADDGGNATAAIDSYVDDRRDPSLSGIVAGGSRECYVTVKNTGDAALAGPFIVNVFATKDLAIGDESVLIGHVQVGQALGVQQSIRVKIAFAIPPSLKVGSYSLLAAATSAHGTRIVFASKIRAIKIK